MVYMPQYVRDTDGYLLLTTHQVGKWEDVMLTEELLVWRMEDKL